jgi:uncharacterized membrane protein YjjB (DUF3815 family)
MTVVAGISYSLINYLSAVTSTSTASMTTAFAVGIAGNLYSRVTNRCGLCHLF